MVRLFIKICVNSCKESIPIRASTAFKVHLLSINRKTKYKLEVVKIAILMILALKYSTILIFAPNHLWMMSFKPCQITYLDQSEIFKIKTKS